MASASAITAAKPGYRRKSLGEPGSDLTFQLSIGVTYDYRSNAGVLEKVVYVPKTPLIMPQVTFDSGFKPIQGRPHIGIEALSEKNGS